MTIDNQNSTELGSLPESILRNIEAITLLETEQGKDIAPHQQILNRVAAMCGQPRFLYGQIIFFGAWWICSHLSSREILPKIPRFDLRQDGLGVLSLSITTTVLIYQNRQDKLAEERSHLSIQLSLLTEQKIVKLIALVEELRIDLPNVRNRYDLEAEEMLKAADPEALLTMLKESRSSSNS